MSQVEQVDVLAVMKEAAEDVVSGDVGLRLLRAAEAVAGLVAAGRLIESGAMPATHSGATYFVPRYEVVNLRKALRPFNGSDKA